MAQGGSLDTGILCGSLEECSLSEEQTQSQLADFPHTFQLRDQERLGQTQLTRLQRGLKLALEVGYDTDDETARARNLLAYALYRLDQPDNALQQLDLVLDMPGQETNLVTLANKAVILWNQGKSSEASKTVRSLTEMKTNEPEFQYLVILAKAEQAYSYTRMGPRFFPYAIITFEEVIPRARDPEEWLWKFGLALMKRRSMRTTPLDMLTPPSKERAKEQRDLLSLLMDIVKNCCFRKLRAKAYSEIAMVLNMVSETPLSDDFCRRADMDKEMACVKALELDSHDSSVLCKCGRIFRYCKQPEKSCELFNRALEIRPSATAYHHLGLSFKALANNEQKYTHQDKGPKRPRSRQAPVTSNVQTMQRLMKSTMRRELSFRRNDKFVDVALTNLEEAKNFSLEENMRATYDLVLMHKRLGEFETAKDYLYKLLKKQCNASTTDLINFCQQMGLILNELAKSEKNRDTKTLILLKSTTILQMALAYASEVFSRSLRVTENPNELCSSLPVLLQEVEKLQNWQEKAPLFDLIVKHRQSLKLITDIEQMDPERTKNPRLCIEEYVRNGQFDTAFTFVKLLECTSQGTATMQLFEDRHYLSKICMQAACQALLLNEPSFAALFFRRAFLGAANTDHADDDGRSESEYSEPSAGSRSDTDPWDVAILNEETEASLSNATALCTLLEDVYGLKVAVTARDAPPNKLDGQRELRILKNSTMIVVLAGGAVSARIQHYLGQIATTQATVTVLVGDSDVPPLLEGNRSHVLSPELLQRCQAASCQMETEDDADTLCELFSFLVDVDMNMLEQ